MANNNNMTILERIEQLDKKVKLLENKFKILDKKVDVQQQVNRWGWYTIDPYCAAYEAGYGRFKDKLNDAIRLDKLKLELALTALSICGGSILAAVFARLTATAVKNAVLDHTTSGLIKRTLSTAKFTASNPTAQFIIGKLYDDGAGKLAANTLRKFDQVHKNFPCIGQFTLAPIDKPEKVKSALISFIGISLDKIYQALEDLQDANKSSSEIDDVVSILLTSPFFHAPKNAGHLPDATTLSEYIELSFYLKMVMDSDSKITRQLTKSGPGSYKTINKQPIHTKPDSDEYKFNSFKPATNSSPAEKTHVHYGIIRQSFITRMNVLTGRYFSSLPRVINSNHFGEQTSIDCLKRAARVLDEIGKRGWDMQHVISSSL